MKKSRITPIVTVPGQEFAEAFRIVETGADMKGNRLIDSHVLVTTDMDKGTVTLRTARTGFSFKYVIRNQAVQTSDQFTLGVKDMNKRLGILKGAVTITRMSDSMVKFDIGNLSFIMRSLDPDDFSIDRSLAMNTAATFSGEELSRYLRLVLATVDPRLHSALGGVWVRSSPGGDALILASARMAHGGTRCEVPVTFEADKPLDVVVPKPLIEAILVGLSVAEKGQAQIALLRDGRGDLIGAQIGDATISGQLANGEFPNIDVMLQTKIATSCLVPRNELYAALNMIALSWENTNMPARTRMVFSPNLFQVCNPVMPDNQATFAVQVSGEPMSMDVNVKQVAATVADLKSSTVRIAVTDTAQRFVFITDPNDPKYLHVAFPFTETYQREKGEELETEGEDEEYQEAA